MPVLKIKTETGWEKISAGPINGGDADTIDGKHADEFATASDVEELQNKIGDTSVSEQIDNAVAQKSQVQIITWEVDD